MERCCSVGARLIGDTVKDWRAQPTACPRSRADGGNGLLGVVEKLGGMTYKIEAILPTRESFDEYTYGIYEEGRLIARYWHDYRGDEHGIEFVSGVSEFWPVGRMTEFVDGGGPKPLVLTEHAVAYIERHHGA